MVDESRSLMETLRKRQEYWIEHVLRHDSLLQKVIEGRFQGKKSLEDQEQCYWMQMMPEDDESEINYAKLKEKAHDRETWRH